MWERCLSPAGRERSQIAARVPFNDRGVCWKVSGLGQRSSARRRGSIDGLPASAG